MGAIAGESRGNRPRRPERPETLMCVVRKPSGMNDDKSDSTDDPPPLDVVESRWWYWIAAYPIALLLFVPLVAFIAVVGLVAATSVTVVDGGPSPGAAPTVIAVIVGAVLVFLILTVIIVSIALIVLLPIALYMDARAVSEAAVDWQPDPFLYGILGVLQIFITPVIGVIIAVYYLYRRHEHVGVP